MTSLSNTAHGTRRRRQPLTAGGVGKPPPTGPTPPRPLVQLTAALPRRSAASQTAATCVPPTSSRRLLVVLGVGQPVCALRATPPPILLHGGGGADTLCTCKGQGSSWPEGGCKSAKQCKTITFFSFDPSFVKKIDVLARRPPGSMKLFTAPDRAQPSQRPRSGKFYDLMPQMAIF